VAAVYLAAAELVKLAILLKIWLIEFEMPGRVAPAATAMKPASRAYSTISWAFSSLSKVLMRIQSAFIAYSPIVVLEVV